MPREFVVDNYRKTFYKKEVNDFVNPIYVPPSNTMVYGAHKTKDGLFLCGTNKFLSRWDGNNFYNIDTTALPNCIIHCVFSGSDGLYISGFNENGIFNPAYFRKYDGLNWTTLSAEGHFHIMSCSQGVFAGKGWGGQTLTRWDGQNISQIGSNSYPIYTVYSASTGIYYGGEYNTLWKYDGINHTNLGIGGPTAHVTSIVEDPIDKNLYVSAGYYSVSYVYKKNIANNTQTQIGESIGGHAITVFLADYLYVGGIIPGSLKYYKDNSWQTVPNFDRPDSNSGIWVADKSDPKDIYIPGKFTYNSQIYNFINYKNMILDEEGDESPPLFIQRTTSVPALRLNSPYRTNTG